jgi:hypothetical protein
MIGSKKRLPRRGTEPYAVLHARQIAKLWDIIVIVARRDDTFFCVIGGTSLNDAELVGRAMAGGRMFVHEGALTGPPVRRSATSVQPKEGADGLHSSSCRTT